MKFWRSIIFLCLFVFLLGCSKGLIEQLGNDPASACGYSTVTYGGGAIVVPSPAIPMVGVYVHQHFCRSNTPGSTVTMSPDGTISVQHGVKEPFKESSKPIETMAPQPKPTIQ